MSESVYHTSEAVRPLGPYEFIATPPIQLVLNVILDQCRIGGSINPGVRTLAEASGVSRGLITDCLRQLTDDGWILYDSRWITLLRDPSQPESDRSADRSLGDDEAGAPDEVIDQLIDQAHDREDGFSPESDRSPDRSESHMVHDSNLTTTRLVVVEEISTIGGSGGNSCADRSPDRSHPAAILLAELLPPPGRGVLAKVLAARDWTPQQIRDRYEYDQRRIAASDGTKTIGVFWTALMAGELAPPRLDPDRPLDPAAYADKPGFALGSAVDPPEAETIRDHAARLLPKPTPETLKIHTRDWVFLQARIGAGDSDEVALAALDAYRKVVRR